MFPDHRLSDIPAGPLQLLDLNFPPSDPVTGEGAPQFVAIARHFSPSFRGRMSSDAPPIGRPRWAALSRLMAQIHHSPHSHPPRLPRLPKARDMPTPSSIQLATPSATRMCQIKFPLWGSKRGPFARPSVTTGHRYTQPIAPPRSFFSFFYL